MNVEGKRQREFLIPPTFALAAQGHRRLAAGEDAGRCRDRVPRGQDLLGNARMDLGDLTRFPLDGGRQDQGMISQGRGLAAGRFQRLQVASDDHGLGAGKDRIAGLGGFRHSTGDAGLQVAANRRRHGVEQLILAQDLQAIGEGTGVGNGWSRGDDVERIAHDVRQHQRDERGRRSQAGKLTSLDLGDMLA